MWYHLFWVFGFVGKDVATVWTPEKIEDYRRASEYTAFHRKLSVLAEPYLDEAWTLLDVGCGPGLLDVWLAPMVARVDAVDVDRACIADFSARLDEAFASGHASAGKIFPRVCDVRELAGGCWDAVLMSFFGLTEGVLDAVLPLASRRALVFMHGRPDGAGPLASEDDGTKMSAQEFEAWLDSHGYAYKKSVMEMQFGQPFRTIEDIHRFLSAFGGGLPGIECIDLGADGGFDDAAVKRMAGAEERIIKTNRFDYPYYLPKSISVALFIIVMPPRTGPAV